MNRLASLVLLAVLVNVGCQVVGKFEDFEGGALTADQVACAALPEAKDDALGTAVMARVDVPGATCVWMDRTEVTVAQYQQWLDATVGEDIAWEPTWCRWKAARSEPAGDPNDACVSSILRFDQQPFAARKPMRCVDFCDAEAYCRWSGKHLCYDRSGLGNQGPSGYPHEWLLACSNERSTQYPWGDSPDESTCNTGQSAETCITGGATSCGPHAAGQGTDCVNQNGIQDLIGNLAEWTFSCTFIDPNKPLEPARCLTRGGGYDDPLGTCGQEGTIDSSTRRPSLGFRCCSDLTASEELKIAAP